MADLGTVVIIGGTSEIGKQVAKHYADQGHPVVLTSRDKERADAAAAELGPQARGLAVDLTKPESVAEALKDVDDVLYLALVAVERDNNSIKDYNIAGAMNLATMKLVGYPAAVHALAGRMRPNGAVVLYGGLAKDRPYPGSTMVTSVNGGVSTMIHTLAIELAPVRVNAIHPGIVGDSPYWAAMPAARLDPIRERTPLGELVTIADIVHANIFLFENKGLTGVNLRVDGGWMLK